MDNYSSWAIPSSTTERIRCIPYLFVLFCFLFGLVGTTTAWAEDARIDVDNANWSKDRDRLTVRGDHAPRQTTVTIRYGRKEDNGAVIGETQSDRRGNWAYSSSNLDPVPCDVTAQAAGVDDDDRGVRRAPNNCSNNGGGAVNQPPTANANGSYSQTLGESISFDSNGSFDPDGSISAYRWEFGDGDSSDQDNPSHTYAAVGTYNVTLTVTDNDGATDSDSTTATIADNQPPANVPPVANANGPYNGTTGVAVSFSSAGSNDSDGTITAFAWNFGDGHTSTQANPSHSYASAGTFTVSLTVTDNGGATASNSTTAAIADQPPVNVPPTANANGPYTGATGVAVSFSSTGSNDSDGTIAAFVWNFGDGASSTAASPSHSYAAAGNFTVTLTVTDDNGVTGVDSTTATITGAVVDCTPLTGVSINTTSQSGCAEQAVPEVNTVLNGNFRVLAINDLGMHCGDYDTRISSILPPFQVLLGQVIQRGDEPTLNPAGVSLAYSSTSNSQDPVLGQPDAIRGLKADGSTYKTNFWDAVAGGAYDPFYPGGLGITPLATGGFTVTADTGLPVPNVEDLYIGADGIVNSGDETLTAVQHTMPGLNNPYFINDPKTVNEHYGDKPFFVNFPFGYVAENVNWYEGAGVPFAAYDDFGYENPYPLVRVEAKQGSTTVATIDTVLPISGEASCTNCHSDPADVQTSRSSEPTDKLVAAGLPVAVSLDDPDPTLPLDVSTEYAADINILRLHDLKHGANYVDTAGNGTPCDVTINGGNGNANCLINKALVQGEPTVCQVCHYTPALDLAQVGPVAGAVGTDANGRNQLAHSSNSNVMHSHHGATGLFPAIPAPIQNTAGTVTNQAERLAAMEQSCYQCHPGTTSQCLRGAMFNGDMLCSDCHGSMAQVGADFSQNVTPDNPAPGSLLLGGNFYDPNDSQPRVPWANEPGCGSCHTGDVRNNLAGTANTIVNTRDVDGNVDNLRLRQAYRSNDGKATPIVPTNKRFAEPAVPATFRNADGSTFANPGAGNPQLYRVSTGHGGVMCEGCHGATHAEWPNGNPASNDNVTAEQLQGHTGAITECGTCHTGNLGNTLGGPHGMHPVGRTSFANGGHHDLGEDNPNACRACHGNNGQGSVLSRAAADRDFRGLKNGGIVLKGEPVTCTECHQNEL